MTKRQTQDCCKDACIKQKGDLNCSGGGPPMADAECVENCLFQNGW